MEKDHNAAFPSEMAVMKILYLRTPDVIKSENKFSDQTVLRLSRHGVVNFERRTSRLSKPPQNCKFVRKAWSKKWTMPYPNWNLIRGKTDILWSIGWDL